jgi:hypothetical protein
MRTEKQTMDRTVLRPRLLQDMTVILILMNGGNSQRRPRLITSKRGWPRASHVVEIKRSDASSNQSDGSSQAAVRNPFDAKTNESRAAPDVR